MQKLCRYQIWALYNFLYFNLQKELMMKETSVPIPQMQLDIAERLSPLQKIISTENLSYIPNLYFRKYKLIESLNHERYDFPQQKILLPRQKTSWDAVLCQMREKAELRKEIQKYKVAQNYHVSKSAKEQFIKKQLKRQEKQLFHRIVANQLGEEVQAFFKNFQNNGQLTNGQTNHEKSKQNEQKRNESKGRGIDDIFIDKQQDDDDIGVDNGGQIDFFDDILNDGVPPKSPLQLMNQNKQVLNSAPQRTINDYVSEFMKETQKMKQSQIQEEGFDYLETHISRRSCLKRINQNLRRRLKTKGAQTQDRSLTSATVALSNLINNYPEYKGAHDFIQLPSQTEWIFDQNVRNKRKKDEDFLLNWSDEQMQKCIQMNERFDLDKLKDMQTVLQLTVDTKEYPKLFQRNISSSYRFASNLNSVKSFSSKFDTKKFYYNEFHDQNYEKFVMKNNKRKLLEKFQKNSNYMFAQHYVQDQIQSNQKIGMGKIFLYPPSKISDRLIYKVTPGSSKISVTAKDYNKKNVPLSRQKIILLSYLVNKYLTEFGNNWKTITEFIEIFPCFSNYLIKPQLVQQLYQMINRHQLKLNYLDDLQIWDKKLLPSSQVYTGSYKDFQKILKNQRSNNKFSQENEMTDQSTYNTDFQDETNSDFSLENFERQLKQPLQSKSNKKQVFSNLSKKYKEYGSKISAVITNQIYNFNQNKIRKANTIIQEYKNTYATRKLESQEKMQNEDKTIQYVQQNMKGQIKSGLPFRKKKNINQRNNELVKILQALRSKNSTTMPPTGPVKGQAEMNKSIGGVQKPSTSQQLNPSASTPAPATQAPLNNKPPTQAGGQKQQKKTKTPQKQNRVSGAGTGGAIKKNKKKDQEPPKG